MKRLGFGALLSFLLVGSLAAQNGSKRVDLKEITDEELEKIVAEIVSEKLKLDRNYIFTTTSKYKVLSNRLQKVVTMSVKYIVQSLKQRRV